MFPDTGAFSLVRPVLTDSPAVIRKETDPISAVDSQADPITSSRRCYSIFTACARYQAMVARSAKTPQFIEILYGMTSGGSSLVKHSKQPQ